MKFLIFTLLFSLNLTATTGPKLSCQFSLESTPVELNSPKKAPLSIVENSDSILKKWSEEKNIKPNSKQLLEEIFPLDQWLAKQDISFDSEFKKELFITGFIAKLGSENVEEQYSKSLNYQSLTKLSLNEILIENLSLTENRHARFFGKVLKVKVLQQPTDAGVRLYQGLGYKYLIKHLAKLEFPLYSPHTYKDFHGYYDSPHSFIGHEIFHFSLIQFKLAKFLNEEYGNTDIESLEKYKTQAKSFTDWLYTELDKESDTVPTQLILHYYAFELGHALAPKAILEHKFDPVHIRNNYMTKSFGTDKERETYPAEVLIDHIEKLKALASAYLDSKTLP